MLKIFTIIPMSLLLAGYSAMGQTTTVSLSTSDVIELAMAVVKSEGYPLSDHKKYFFDLLPRDNVKPVWPGYITIGFYWNNEVQYAISINEHTFQVLEINQCISFEYPEIVQAQKELKRETGITPIPLPALAKQFGCDRMKRVSRAVRPPKRLR